MKGPAGVGKSTIAQTCMEKLKGMGRLGAIFFFAVRIQDKAAQFFPTIIYQLCSEFPDYRNLFQVLVVEPLQELEKKGKGIGKRIAIFIDGLDECESVNAQCKIISIVAKAPQDRTILLCWAVFSRPEAHIEGTFAIPSIIKITSTSILPISHNTDGDIELYLCSSFENILRCHNISLKSRWPSNDDIHTLVHAANGLFVYVATATEATNTPQSPFAELDAFYMLIMGCIPSDTLPSVLLFLHEMWGLSHNSVPLISNCLGFSEVMFKAVYNHLSAVVHLQGQDESPPYLNADVNWPFQYFIYCELGGSMYFYHKSFWDFSVDPRHSGPFYVLSSATWNTRESYCIQGSGVPDSASSLSSPYTNELVNSLLKAYIFYWIHHTFLYPSEYSSIDPRLLQQFQHTDFRKSLHVEATLYSSPKYGQGMLDYSGISKFVSGTQLFQRFSGGLCKSLQKFDKRIGELQQVGIIWTCDPSCISSFMSLFPAETQDQCITGLYHMGHGSRSVFWYWEINVKSGYCQEMRTVDLAEGGRIY
ncbi:hypothetical protein P691DRAFT_844715 [Macrolepiota fuliginosa MF-IS2]|uniref:Nephrocystin 3-like N-terminal domain-containing protein n=1 Tax=Macrolepiota fuliginosa MF-IS2 TaxID=1400762 RepID=A0A9P6BWI1_9AGAR|nr:hypothetical protein P691DRAFT_844715 [Macrolepiota fuliginosa MF-IS2]